MRRVILAGATILFVGGTVQGWYHTGGTWPSGAIVMHLQLGGSGGTLMNGCGDWACAAEDGLNTWNYYLDPTSWATRGTRGRGGAGRALRRLRPEN